MRARVRSSTIEWPVVLIGRHLQAAPGEQRLIALVVDDEPAGLRGRSAQEPDREQERASDGEEP